MLYHIVFLLPLSQTVSAPATPAPTLQQSQQAAQSFPAAVAPLQTQLAAQPQEQVRPGPRPPRD